MALAAVLAAAVVSGGAVQRDERVPGKPFDLDYRIRLAGFSIGEANLSGGIGGGRYRLDLETKLTGLVGWVTGISGTGSAQGVTGRRVVPAAYRVDIEDSKHPVAIRVGLVSGNVVDAALTPPLEPRPDRIPVLDQHRKGVVDPISALLALHPGAGPLLDPSACNRTLPVFDGAGRFDVKLAYSDMRSVKIPGYEGAVLVCAARYVPVSGHRERPSVQFMRDNRDMEVWLAPVAGTRALLPVRIVVATRVGRLVIEARRMATAAGPAADTTEEAYYDAPESSPGGDPVR